MLLSDYERGVLMINLFEHNRIAYESAVAMLQKTGKAAIVHPTGTGKSFIGFKLCEEYTEKKVCWLSPSEYIFKTQLENLKFASDGYEPENIVFFTYAKLMNLTEAELLEIQPDFIILDEFHRCGAEFWGQGVQNLLNQYPEVPILGLSATAVRYLDNQRDMSDELFDGNIASEMTLGEAIVRGILNPPKYVLSMFSYRQELERYEKKVRQHRNTAVRDTADRYLEALKRTLDMADGLDNVFAKHITDKGGKYIVFCANFEHMQEMIGKAVEWFYKIDKHPRIYSVYSSDPSASKSFADFKADNDTSHLRLLYCIDALNEGIHLEDISGVILLRPTVSPIIYKQQIGRALSASKKREVVIFDIVMNIENLYSIGAVEEEMQIATSYYRSLGESKAIVNEHFGVIDELRDCRALFDKLENTLMASWDIMYGYAKQYYEQFGNLEIPARYKTEDGYFLGRWLFNQKGIRKGQMEGRLTEEQISKLDAIGMIWGYYNDLNWERNYAAAKKYFEKNGNLDVHTRYTTEDGLLLGLWLCSLRTWERAGVHPKYLTAERKAQLEKIGMIWDKLDFYWERNYLSACAYFKEHRNLDVPANYVDNEGIRLGSWIGRIRKLRKGQCRGTPPSEEQIARLDSIGMMWGDTVDNRWEKGFREAELYVKQNGNLFVPTKYITPSGVQLGAWIQRQRLVYKQKKILPERQRRLEAIGMVWEADTWETRFALVKKYYEENRTLDIPQDVVVSGVWIGKWIWSQKKYMNSGKLTHEQIKMLSTLPMEQVGAKNKSWYALYTDAKTYKQEHGTLNGVSATYKGKSGFLLSNWIYTQRRKYRLGELSDEQIRLLNDIQFEWEAESESYWEKGYCYAKAFFREHGHLEMEQRYKTEDGFALGLWVGNYRKAYNGMKTQTVINDEQIAMLEAIGMVWKKDKIWDKRFADLEVFYKTKHRMPKPDSDNKDELVLGRWLYSQRKYYRDGYITKHKLDKFASVGITKEWFEPPTPFEKGYVIAKSYYEEHSNLDISTNYQHPSGFWLGSWVDKIRKKRDELNKEQIKRLNAIGFVWEPADNWEEKYTEAKAYYDKYGTLPLEPKQCKDKSERLICQWLRRQLLRRNDGKMPQNQIDKLTAIGMDWLNSLERSWMRGLSHAQAYHATYGHLDVITTFVCEDGYPLGEWLHSQRTHRKRLTQDKLQALISLGARGLTV